MKCYTHAKAGEDKEAVAVCSECGMGLCMEHVVEVDLPVLQRPIGVVEQRTMHILCRNCAKTMGLMA